MVNYTHISSFEVPYTYDELQSWMTENWTLCFYLSGIYLVLIYIGQNIMKNREPFELRFLLFLWNSFLASGSTLGMVRGIPLLIDYFQEHGFHHCVCNPEQLYEPIVCNYAWFFAVSKIVELGDTAFIILRKQRLLFLHWYHHITAFCYVWYVSVNHNASARLFGLMNVTVHAFMYSYYAARSAEIKVPRLIKMFVTLIQIAQMVLGVYITLYTYGAMVNGEPCYVNMKNIRASFLMYFSYFLLFTYFFRNSYLRKKEPKESAKEG